MTNAEAKTRRIQFGDIEIAYDHRVLEPRPWTLVQSEWATELSRDDAAGPILELCSGAGHIGLAAATRTGRPLVQVDANPAACELARRNADRTGFGTHVEVRCGLLSDSIAATESFAVIIADPPYLRTDEVADFPDDPPLAVDGGADGLDVVRACLEVIDRSLERGGPALVQVRGREQGQALAAILPPRLAIVEIREVDPERAVALLRHVDPGSRRKVASDTPGQHRAGRG